MIEFVVRGALNDLRRRIVIKAKSRQAKFTVCVESALHAELLRQSDLVY